MDDGMTEQYNYDEFVPDKYSRWMRFDESPVLGEKGPDFPLWKLSGEKVQLGEVLAAHRYTVVEFGSFT
jgi:hypothetical protein